MNFRLHPEACKEIQEAVFWYEDQQSGLGCGAPLALKISKKRKVETKFRVDFYTNRKKFSNIYLVMPVWFFLMMLLSQSERFERPSVLRPFRHFVNG